MLSDKILNALAAFYALPKADIKIIKETYQKNPIVDLDLDHILILLEYPESHSLKELKFALDDIVFDLQYIEKTRGSLSNELNSFLKIMRSQIYDI